MTGMHAAPLDRPQNGEVAVGRLGEVLWPSLSAGHLVPQPTSLINRFVMDMEASLCFLAQESHSDAYTICHLLNYPISLDLD